MIEAAHAHGVPVLVDGAQSVSHMPVNVGALDADFFVFSGHKIFGPTGIGALYGKSALLEAARPYQGGGNMISDVTFERTLYQTAPAKFEAGTGNIADAVGLGAALDYVSAIGMENIAVWEHELTQYGIQELAKVPGLRLVGRAAQKTGVLSFVLAGRGNEEVARHLNSKGIAVRAGHHCAQPGLRFFGLEGTVRPSLAFYNSFGEIDQLAAALREIAG
jgi:cysteine desulfurase/selenocysteine lyase